MENVKKERNIAIQIILTFITCGIYGIIWFVQMTDDVVYKNERKIYSTSGGMAFLLTLITCGIYHFFWCYQMGKAIQAIQQSKGLPSHDNSFLYIVLSIFGLGIVNYCLIQNDLNNIG